MPSVSTTSLETSAQAIILVACAGLHLAPGAPTAWALTALGNGADAVLPFGGFTAAQAVAYVLPGILPAIVASGLTCLNLWRSGTEYPRALAPALFLILAGAMLAISHLLAPGVVASLASAMAHGTGVLLIGGLAAAAIASPVEADPVAARPTERSTVINFPEPVHGSEADTAGDEVALAA